MRWPHIWVPAAHRRDQDGIPRSRSRPALDLLLLPFGDWTSAWKVFLSCSAFQINSFSNNSIFHWNAQILSLTANTMTACDRVTSIYRGNICHLMRFKNYSSSFFQVKTFVKTPSSFACNWHNCTTRGNTLFFQDNYLGIVYPINYLGILILIGNRSYIKVYFPFRHQENDTDMQQELRRSKPQWDITSLLENSYSKKWWWRTSRSGETEELEPLCIATEITEGHALWK